MRKAIVVATAMTLLSSGSAWAQSDRWATASDRFSIAAEALLWWQKESPTPVPVITDGLLGQAGTRVLLGGGTLDANPAPGFRIAAAYAVTDRWSIEGNVLRLAQRSTSRSIDSSGAPGSTDLLLPFFDVTRNREEATEISLSPVYGGRASVELTHSLTGAEANAAWGVSSERVQQLRMIAGFRWLQLREKYTLRTSSPANPPQAADVWDTTDRFDAKNDFYGAQFGAQGRFDRDRWFASGMAKMAVGAVVQFTRVSGSLATNDFDAFGAPQTFPGGYFALPSNIGERSRTVFAVVPEVRMNLGYRLTPSMSIVAGYSFVYASSVVRPGNQIDRNIDPRQSASYVGSPVTNAPGAARPSFRFNSSDFWAQGINVGLSVAF